MDTHRQTAQVFSAVKMELELLRGQVPDIAAPRLERLLGLVDKGIRGIRSVVNDLRPSLLDDLGLLPALRSLVADFGERSAIRITLDAPPGLPPLSKDAELAVFRALQEALSNVVRHANAKAVSVQIAVRGRALTLVVADDGTGPHTTDTALLEREGHMGLTGMRERIAALGGSVRFDGQPGAGARVEVQVPIHRRGGRMNDAPIRVLVADDHAMVREGIRSVLEREGFQVVGEATTGAEVLPLAEVAAARRGRARHLDAGGDRTAGRRATPARAAAHPRAHPQHVRQHRVRAGERARRRAWLPAQGWRCAGTRDRHPHRAGWRGLLQPGRRRPALRGGSR